MFKLYILALSFLLAISINYVRAQQKPPINPGTAKGILRDSVHKYVLKSATVSIYKAVDSSLLSYQITNNYGVFSFNNLPVNIPLRLDINHVGYAATRKKFSIPAGKNSIDFGTLIIDPKNIMLNEVTVTVPPITMNGDTLEFNAAAFKLDSNAVVEDLLKKIPNITLWGDGQITVNGREVKSLLVNGKDFFGGDFKIATQNIPKNALQKVQVYSTKNETNPLDSTLSVNLKLKKGKDIGHFGKIGFGYGTDKRYEADASINFFTPKMQLAVIAASNNINKSTNSIQDLTANSTFKGSGTNIAYQSDFRASGITQSNAIGVSFNYNFIEKPTYDNRKTLSANYLLQDKNLDNSSQTETTTSINTTDKIIEKNSSTRTTESTNHKFDSKYEWRKRNKSFDVAPSFNRSAGQTNNLTFRSAENSQNEVTSTNNTANTNNFSNNGFNLKANYRLSSDYLKRNPRFQGLIVGYSLSVNNNQNTGINLTDFTSFTNPGSNKKFNRKNNNQSDVISQQIDIEFPKLKSLFFGKAKLAGIDFSITNGFNLRNSKNNNRVEDLNVATNAYENNVYLSNKIETDYVDETPGLSISRIFSKNLSNRYNKNLTISFAPKQKFVIQNNRSDKAFQNINRNYSQFLPDANISYNDNEYGDFYRNFTLAYNTSIGVPTIQQLAPLIDSTNVYSIRKGNINLKESVTRLISFNFHHYDQGNKNPLNYNFNLSAGKIDDSIVDSTFIDNSNRRTIYLTNADGNRFANFYGNISKALKLKNSEIQFNLNLSGNTSKSPSYTNGLFAFSKNLNTSTALKVNYTYKSALALVVGQSFETYKSAQEAFNTKYTGVNKATSFASSYNITKKFTLNTNLSFNSSSSANAENVDFTIWNASAIYRMLKGNNAEFKLSALDILHQNTSVIIYGSSNSFTTGTQKVLQQYFMLTFSYFPRQFGKNPPKK